MNFHITFDDGNQIILNENDYIELLVTYKAIKESKISSEYRYKKEESRKFDRQVIDEVKSLLAQLNYSQIDDENEKEDDHMNEDKPHPIGEGEG